MSKPKTKLQLEACVVLYVKYIDGNVRTFWSRDSAVPEKKGNVGYWYNHLAKVAQTRWPGRVKEYVIFRAENGSRIGDHILKESL